MGPPRLLPPELPPPEEGGWRRAAFLLLVLLGALGLVVGLVRVPAALWIGIPALVGAAVVLLLSMRAADRSDERNGGPSGR